MYGIPKMVKISFGTNKWQISDTEFLHKMYVDFKLETALKANIIKFVPRLYIKIKRSFI